MVIYCGMVVAQRVAAGETQRAVAAAFGVGNSVVNAIVNNKSWVPFPTGDES
jgi:plasmid maintenance system antidote protein VapI